MQILVIGGGAAGFFGAIRAAETNPGARVIILERGREVLSKVRISGGGRCNVTHACWEPSKLAAHYPRGERELLGPFHRFACGDTVAWFQERGVRLKTEEDGRMFPVSDDSGSIVQCLEQQARKLGVELRLHQRLEQLRPPQADSPLWQVKVSGSWLSADRVMLATGSSPAVWQILAQLGHRIIAPVPSLFTFNIKDTRLSDLAGISVPRAALQIENSRLSASGPLLITHWGLSGPAVLRLSAWGARELHERTYQAVLKVNWLGKPAEEVNENLKQWRAEGGKRQAGTQPMFGLPARLWRKLVEAAGIDPGRRVAELGQNALTALSDQLLEGRFVISGKSTFKEEFVTAGGVDLREVDFKTFQSKKFPGLFFAGEVLDIDAITGGFNFQAAWTGGWIAGEAMARTGPIS